ncbi:response regulator receiver domain [Aliivibrio salmonicida]|uniref:response regulator receiver domain n=1 Tax=Aliivibrio salmonicida TaxID=40269 RepID=UPI001F5C7105|nr:response regulator receiver domain [Aliivibrio salmonicida]
MNMTDLIKEAYIDPIRSVMVVDDEYPTLSKLILGQDTSEPHDKNRLHDVVQVCRLPENNWMLDVHDGQFTGTGDVDNLHHSDLLILDYHLEGTGDDGKGLKSLSVLSTLAKKEHFNLVIVHTKGYADIGGDEGYRAVFKDIVFHLQQEKTFLELPEKLLTQVINAIDFWDEEQSGILESLIDSVADLDYLKLLALNCSPMKIETEKNELLGLKVIYDSRPMGRMKF